MSSGGCMGPLGWTVTGVDENSMSVVTNKLLTTVQMWISKPLSSQLVGMGNLSFLRLVLDKILNI